MRRIDALGLSGALPGRLLAALVAAAVLLAALALGAASGAASLAAHWRLGAASLLVVSVPDPGDPSGRAARVAQALRGAGLDARRVEAGELARLLRPWLGDDPAAPALDLPAVFTVRLAGRDPGPALDAAVAAAAPGAHVARQGAWLARLGVLAGSVQACAALALALVGGIAAATVAVATHGALGATRPAVEILHGLGATDGAIAGRFARHLAALALAGAVPGAVLALPVLLFLARLGAPLVSSSPSLSPAELALSLPGSLGAALVALPLLAAAIAAGTAQVTVRRWLRRLP